MLASSQTTGAADPYSFSYSYDLAENLKMVQYPSGRKVWNTYDTAGRLCAVGSADNLKCTDSGQYASNVSYTPHGAMAGLSLKNGISETWLYNSRLQPCALGVNLGSASAQAQQPCQLTAASSGATRHLSLTWDYGAGSTNNGNVVNEGIVSTGGVNGTHVNVTQTFTYDSWNRLRTAVEGVNWQQQYEYDKFGNRALLSGTLSGQAPNYIPGGNWTPQVSTDGATQVEALFPGNRWTETGVQYDNGTADRVGNLTGLPGFTFGYDAENRQTSAVGGSTVAIYKYDGNGRRVLKVECEAGTSPCTAASSGAKVTTYVYDASGKLAAEYATAPSPAPCTTCFLTADHLGSTRMMTDGTSGLPVAFHDYLPFGEEIPEGIGGRGPLYGLGDPKQKFTGKERDAETGLDYFGARYFSGAMGRFTSADAPFADQSPVDPQSWNLYAYGRNNPLRFIDPTGRDCTSTNGGSVYHEDNAGDCAASKVELTPAYSVTHVEIDDTIYGSNGGSGGAIMGMVYSDTYVPVNVLGYATFAAVPYAYVGAFLAGLSTATVAAAGTVGVGAAESPQGQEAIASGETVWSSITATQPLYEGTVIPRSFALATENGSVWVHGNASEHLAEYATSMLGKGVSSGLVDMASQTQLAGLRAAVQSAIAGGVPLNQTLQVAGWELRFAAPRVAGELPALIHAQPIQ